MHSCPEALPIAIFPDVGDMSHFDHLYLSWWHASPLLSQAIAPCIPAASSVKQHTSKDESNSTSFCSVCFTHGGLYISTTSRGRKATCTTPDPSLDLLSLQFSFPVSLPDLLRYVQKKKRKEKEQKTPNKNEKVCCISRHPIKK